jgi:general transcription factor IIIA
MSVLQDDDFEQVSPDDTSEADDSDFVEAENDTPSSTPPHASPRLNLIPSRTKRFKCSWDGCTKAFVRQSRLDEHIRSHTNTRPFACPEDGCDKTYLRASHMKVHVASAHTRDKDYKCTWKGCDKSFATGQRFRNHLKVHEGQEKYRCTGYEGCNQTFRKKDTLRRHVVSVHEQRKPFPCPDTDSNTGFPCSKAFDTAQKLRAHQKTNHDDKRYSCEDCLAFNAIIDQASPDTHHTPTYFATFAQLQAHNQEYHPPTCSDCRSTFTTQKQLAAHMELEHDAEPDPAAKAKRRLSCPHTGCTKSFSKQGNLNVHIRSAHERSTNFVCGETEISLPDDEVPVGTAITACGRSFSSKQVLEDHIRTAHLGLESMQTRRKKRKATSRDGPRPKRTKTARSQNARDEDTAFSNDLPDFIWPQAAMNDDEEDQANEVMDLSESMSMLGSHIWHHGTAYHYPSGEYPSSSNSMELQPVPEELPEYQMAPPSIGDGMFGPVDDFEHIGVLDPRLLEAPA